jgi:hypothetical protein
MALTLAEVSPLPPTKKIEGGYDQGWNFKVVTITFDSSYPTGGELLAAADVGLTSIAFVDAECADGFALEYDYTNSKLKAFTNDNDAVADGAMIEVANATDLSAIDARVLIVGR